jgi:hypothetical protein
MSNRAHDAHYICTSIKPVAARGCRKSFKSMSVVMLASYSRVTLPNVPRVCGENRNCSMGILNKIHFQYQPSASLLVQECDRRINATRGPSPTIMRCYRTSPNPTFRPNQSSDRACRIRCLVTLLRVLNGGGHGKANGRDAPNAPQTCRCPRSCGS